MKDARGNAPEEIGTGAASALYGAARCLTAGAEERVEQEGQCHEETRRGHRLKELDYDDDHLDPEWALVYDEVVERVSGLTPSSILS